MTPDTDEFIAFDVETERILQILSAEIYDSPKAFLRENLQNAYDAVLMRCAAQQVPIEERSIFVTVEEGRLTVEDDGIGMTDDVLRNNFWKAGSSGKRSDLAQRAGVIGTFGIGAMANFGVCTALTVTTKNINSNVTLVSSARRADLRIAKNCIQLNRVSDDRSPGTVVEAELDSSFTLSESDAAKYLSQYVRFLPVPVFLNGNLISQESFEAALDGQTTGFTPLASREIKSAQFSATVHSFINVQARVLVRVDDISFNGRAVPGSALLLQQGGQTLGFRNLFGLAPIPITSSYSFGGFINLGILHPTAGREALSRESIKQVSDMVALLEAEVSRDLAESPLADQNALFQQFIASHGLIRLAKNVRIAVLPAGPSDIPLGEVMGYESSKPKHYYTGRDSTILQRFAGEQATLFHVSQTNPRRGLQMRYLKDVARLSDIPEKTIVDLVPPSGLTVNEAMFLIRLRGVLLDEYFMPDVDVALASISHGVSLQVELAGKTLRIAIARNMPALKIVIEAYTAAREVFHGFVIDFVRQQLYPHIRDHVPSSTRQGRDALYRRLKENEELFRYDASDFGKAESLLADYLAGKADLDQVLRSSSGSGSGYRQEVRKEQVGSVEEELPDIIDPVADVQASSTNEAAPPIVRPDITSTMKVLTVAAQHAKLNGIRMFLAVSDRLTRSDGEFLRQPHSTKVMWGSHRVIYVFTDATGELSLYYDIKLKEPLDVETTGGTMLPTTTIVTKNRIFIPVPAVLEPAFSITEGAKEFFVRFDTIP